jgi:hypothetical protein
MATPEQINEKFEPRIRKILAGIAEALKEDGWKVGEVCDMSCDEYRYAILASQYDEDPSELREGDVDITFEICESEHCDGSEDGCNFAIQVVKVGGEIVGGLTPYNYTQDVWVPRVNDEAVEARFTILERADAGELVCLLEDCKDY